MERRRPAAFQGGASMALKKPLVTAADGALVTTHRIDESVFVPIGSQCVRLVLVQTTRVWAGEPVIRIWIGPLCAMSGTGWPDEVGPMDGRRVTAHFATLVVLDCTELIAAPRRTAIRLRGGDVLVEDFEVPPGLPLNGLGS